MIIRLLILAFVGGMWVFQYSDSFTRLPTDTFHPVIILGLELFTIAMFWLFLRCLTPKYYGYKTGILTALITLTFIFGYLYSHSYGNQQLRSLLENKYAGLEFDLLVTLDDLPKKTYFGYRYDFKVLKMIDPPSSSSRNYPQQIRINEYTKNQPIKYGSVWLIKARLFPIHSSYSPASFDYEGWLYKNGIGARGSLRKRIKEYPDLNQKYSINRLREYLLNRLKQFEQQQNLKDSAIILPDSVSVLGLGVQANLDQNKWKTLRQSGTIHLFSISGIHVTLIAILFSIIVNFLWRRNFYLNQLFFFAPNKIPNLCNYISAQTASITLGLICAWLYAAICGFSIPTERTVIMLTISYLVWIKGYRNSWINTLALTFLIITITDPMALLDTGFWLSFAGVCILIIFTHNQSTSNQVDQFTYWLKPSNPIFSFLFKIFKPAYSALVKLSKVQLIFTIVLLPLFVLFFNEWSTISVVANLIAIPLISWVVVPISIFLVFFPSKYGFLILQSIQDLFFDLMTRLVEFSPSLPIAKPSFIAFIFAIIGAIYFLLPKGILNKWLVLVFILPIIFSVNKKIDYGEAQIIILDVGSGLSVLVKTQNHNLVYDTGAKFGNYSPASFVFIPLARSQGIKKINRLIISHSDNDHAGGFIPIIKNIPVDEILLGDLPSNWHKFFKKTSDLNQDIDLNYSYCQTKWSKWQWDGVNFAAIKAKLDDSSNKNDQSCILKISTRETTFLLTGDIEENAMTKLTQDLGNQLASDYLLIPHHGSPTSEYQKFYQAVNPQYAIISGGLQQKKYPTKNLKLILNKLNNFKHIYHTWYDGTISLHIQNNNQNPAPLGYRQVEPHYWHIATTS